MIRASGILVGFTAAIFYVTAACAATQPESGLVKNVSGHVAVVRAGTAITPRAGTPLVSGDEVRTGKDGSVGIGFLDGTRVSLGPDSSLAVRDYAFRPQEKRFAFKMYMKKGSMTYASGKLGKLAPEAVAIDTPQASVGIRGTKLLIKVDE